MNIFVISTLLFFEICTGLSLHRIQLQKHSAENLTDVYEIEEDDKKTIRFVYPKSEKSTLREITYLHVRESPYSEHDEDSDPEGMDVDDVTRRPFTNSHGFQFLKEDPEIIFEAKHLAVTGENGKVTEGALDSAEDVLLDEEYGDALEELEVDEALTTKAIQIKETTTVAPTTTTTEVMTTLTDSEKPIQEKISARNLLFSQAKGKYQLRKQENPTQRHKRETSLKDLPPAPTLAPLDLSILPEDVKRMLSLTSKSGTTMPKQVQTHLSKDEFKKELEHKIEDIISSLSPKRDEEENKDDDNDEQEDDDDDDDTDDYDEDDDYWDDVDPEIVDEIEDSDAKVRKPRTYGMNLKNGRGYVWNDLLSEPGTQGMSFDVGEQDDLSDNKEIDTSEHKKPESTEQPTTVEQATAEPMITASYPTESRPIYMPSDNNESDKKEDSIKPNEEPSEATNEPMITASYPTESRPIYMSSDNNESDKQENLINPIEESSDNKDLEDIEVSTKKARLLPNENDPVEKQNDKKEKLVTGDVKLKSQGRHENLTDGKKEHNKQHKKKHQNKAVKVPENNDLFKELMKNEQFWKWLSEWTATYMELLMKHIKDVVEDEVASQMKMLAAKLKKDLSKQNSSDNPKKTENSVNNPEILKDNKLVIDGKEIPITHTNNFDSVGEKETTISDISEDSKLVIDDKEIPKTHTTNFDSVGEKNETYYYCPLTYCANKDDYIIRYKSNKKNSNSNVTKDKGHNGKRKEHDTANVSNKDSNKSRVPTSIRAQNIFGNTVGSDKVTNIFVFYPEDDESKNDIKENIKPLINGANNVFTFGSDHSGSDDNVNIDKRLPEITGQKDESTMTEKKPQIVSTFKPDIDNSHSTETPNTKESKTEKRNDELYAEPTQTTTPKSDAKRTENANDKKEVDNTTLAKERDSAQDNPQAAANEHRKGSSESNTDNTLESKQKEIQKTEDWKKAEEIKDNDKKVEDASVSSVKAETTAEPPSDNEKDSRNDDKKTENKKHQEAEDSKKAEEIKAGDKTDGKNDNEATESDNNKTESTTGSPSDNEKDSRNNDRKTEENDRKEGEDSKKAEEIKTGDETDDKKDKATESKSKETTLSSSSDINGHEDQKSENQDNAPKQEITKESEKEIEKKSSKEEESSDSEKEDDKVILQA